MFNFFRKPKIEFYPIIPQLMDTHPPDNGMKDLTSIFKKFKPVRINPELQHSTKVTAKNCPAVIEYCKYGYVFRAWQDIKITTSADGENYNWQTPTNTNVFLSEHWRENTNFEKEVFHFLKDTSYPYFHKEGSLKYLLQIPTRWCIKLPKDYGALFLPVWYDNEQRFSIVPGLLPAETVEEINIVIQWHKLGTEEIIKAGTPLVRIIPFKMEKDNVIIRQATKQDAYTFRKFNLLKGNHW